MLIKLLEKIQLVCPQCRDPAKDMYSILAMNDIDEISSEHVMTGDLKCPDCGSKYPIIGGVPCILKDIDIWQAKVNEEPDPDPVTKIFNEFHYGKLEDLQDWPDDQRYWSALKELSKGNYLNSLDLGCSVGRHTFELAEMSDTTLGIDLRLSSLKLAVIRQIEHDVTNILFIAADALDPPLIAGMFDHASALNLLDNVRYPLTLMGQMNALLKPDGQMLLATPYAWQENITPSEEWLTPDDVIGALRGSTLPQCGFSYNILAEEDQGWTLRNNERQYSHYISHIVKAKKN